MNLDTIMDIYLLESVPYYVITLCTYHTSYMTNSISYGLFGLVKWIDRLHNKGMNGFPSHTYRASYVYHTDIKKKT